MRVDLKHPLILICMAQFCIAMGMNLVNPLLPLYASSFEISYAMVGLMMSSFGLTRIVVEIPAGILTDRIGRKPIMLVGYVLSTLSHLIAAFAQTFVELIVSRMIMGCGSSLLLTASLIYVGEIAPDSRRSRYIALFQSMYSIPGIVAPTLGGVVSEGFGIRTIFLLSTAISAIGLFLVFSMQVSGNAPTAGGRTFSSDAVLELVKNRQIIALSVACFMTFFLFSSVRGTMIPLYGSEALGLNSIQIGLIFSLTSAITVLILVFLTHQLERLLGKSLLLPLSLLVCSLAVFLISLASDFLTLFVSSVPLGIGFGLLQPTPFSMLIDYSSPERRGLAMGVLRTIGDLGLIVGPLMVGWLMDLGQALLVFYVVALSVGLFSPLTRKVFRKSTEH